MPTGILVTLVVEVLLILIIPNIVKPTNGYFAGPQILNWTLAKSYCESQNTTLASIHSFEDWQEALNTCIQMDKDYCWIGLHDPTQTNNYQYVDGTLTDYAFINGKPTIGIEPWQVKEPCCFDEACIMIVFEEWEGRRDGLDDIWCWERLHPMCNDMDMNKDNSEDNSEDNNVFIIIIVISAIIAICCIGVCKYVYMERTANQKRIGTDLKRMGTDAVDVAGNKEVSEAEPSHNDIEVENKKVNVEIHPEAEVIRNRNNSELLYVNKEKAAVTKGTADGNQKDMKTERFRNWMENTVKLSEYCNLLVGNGCDSLEFVVMLTMDDLKEIGIHKIVHRRRIFECAQQLSSEEGDAIDFTVEGDHVYTVEGDTTAEI